MSRSRLQISKAFLALVLCGWFTAAVGPVTAQSTAPAVPAPAATPLPAPPDPASWLGLTPETAYRDRGAPAEIYPFPVDDKRWEVVHFYGDHTYLYWSSNHVWQVRLDKLWTGSLKGVVMGAKRADAESAFGPPLAKGDTWSVWDLPYQSFPRRIRLVFTDGILSDAYLYRSDL